jgi:hypothetical protein
VRFSHIGQFAIDVSPQLTFKIMNEIPTITLAMPLERLLDAFSKSVVQIPHVLAAPAIRTSHVV